MSDKEKTAVRLTAAAAFVVLGFLAVVQGVDMWWMICAALFATSAAMTFR